MPRSKAKPPRRGDKQTLALLGGVGLSLVLLGATLLWAAMQSTGPGHFFLPTLPRLLAGMLPHKTQLRIVCIFGASSVLFGLTLTVIGVAKFVKGLRGG